MDSQGSHPSRGRLARRCTEFISGRAKGIPSTRRLLFLVAPGVDAISSADCWVCILVRLCWAPLHTTCADLTHFTTLHYSSLLFHWGWRLDSWNLLQCTWCQRQSALLGFSRDLGPIAESSGALRLAICQRSMENKETFLEISKISKNHWYTLCDLPLRKRGSIATTSVSTAFHSTLCSLIHF